MRRLRECVLAHENYAPEFEWPSVAGTSQDSTDWAPLSAVACLGLSRQPIEQHLRRCTYGLPFRTNDPISLRYCHGQPIERGDKRAGGDAIMGETVSCQRHAHTLFDGPKNQIR